MLKDFFERKVSAGILPVILAAIMVIGAFSYLAYRYYYLQRDFIHAKEQFQTTSQNLQNSITDLERHLASTTDENIYLNDFLTVLKARNADFQNEVSDISQKISSLEKLKNTDPQLLQKYSKVYFLNENYIPSDLALLEQDFVFSKTKPIQIHTKVKPHLESMIRAARADGIEISALSGYRSFGTQAELKSQYSVIYGAKTANKFSADQGYSEHQLGTTIDLTTKKTGEALTGFNSTPAYKWLSDNAYKYGFILSYPHNNSYYIFEPWHWRFVGTKLAGYMHDQTKNFYDLPQRDIDSYLINFFD